MSAESRQNGLIYDPEGVRAHYREANIDIEEARFEDILKDFKELEKSDPEAYLQGLQELNAVLKKWTDNRAGSS